jgi:uncharacterized protein (DUF697 family)
MATLPAVEWDVVPATLQQIEAAAREARRLASRRALFAAGVAVVPIPGLDWATNVGVLIKLLPDINRVFGLSAEQVERLAPDRQVVVFKTLTAAGSLVIGRIVTREVVTALLRVVGLRLSAQQAVKYVPIAGQGLSAALTYGALRYVCEQHIRQCIAICGQLRLPAPTVVAEQPAATIRGQSGRSAAW